MGDNIAISTVHEGDILAIHTAGAYGSSMSSNYNMRPFATEIIIDGEKMMLTRKRQSYEDMIGIFENILYSSHEFFQHSITF